MSGELYRAKMRVIHRFGLCWPQPVAVEPGRVWCHWCGMRGHRTTAEQLAAAEHELTVLARRKSATRFGTCDNHNSRGGVHQKVDSCVNWIDESPAPADPQEAT